jgi:hemerythrin
MSFWSWDPSLSVGIEIIDRQHQRIVDYINDLHSAHLEKDQDKVSAVLAGLRDYTLTHFTFEEDLMESSGYPLSETHKMVHNSFVAHLDKLVEQHENGKDVSRKLMSMLQVWLTNHIKNDDKDYSSIVKEMLSQHEGWFKRTANRLFR